MTKLKVGDRVAATKDLPFWHTVTGVVQKVHENGSVDVLIDEDAKYEDGTACMYRGSLSFQSRVWESIDTPREPTPAELAERYRKSWADAVEARKTLANLEYVMYQEYGGSSMHRAPASLADHKVEFRKKVTTVDVV